MQPYVQSSLAPRANQKLSFKFFGPFQIAARVGSVAYRLLLPPTSQIHLVFHVSQLKQALPVKHQVAELPSSLTGLQVPKQVLQCRVSSNDSSAVVLQGLIKWFGLHPSLATWEDLEPLKQRFPNAPAWGQAGPKGRGSVTAAPTAPALPEAGPSAVPRTATAQRKSERAKFPSTRTTGPQWA